MSSDCHDWNPASHFVNGRKRGPKWNRTSHTKEQESDQMDENLGLQSLQPYGPIDNGFSFSLETCVY